jgi:hypothetical protein
MSENPDRSELGSSDAEQSSAASQPASEPDKPGVIEQIVRYLSYASAVFVVSSFLGKAAEILLDLPSAVMEKYGEGFYASLSRLDPWNLASVFYGYLSANWPANEDTISYIVHGDFIPASQFRFLWRVVPGGFYTAGTIFSQGWVNSFTAAVSVAIGVAIVWKMDIPWIFKAFVVPMIGCVCLWILLETIYLAGAIFGDHFETVQMGTYLSLLLPLPTFFVHAAIREREHHFTGLIVKLITKR